jgi:hypothetical protein
MDHQSLSGGLLRKNHVEMQTRESITTVAHDLWEFVKIVAFSSQTTCSTNLAS